MSRRWVPVYPRGGKCFLGAKECADAHIAAALHGKTGERYLLGGHNLSYQEFMNEVSSVIGCRPPKMPIPRVALSMAGRIGGFLNQVDPHRFAGLEPHVLRSMQEERYRSPQKMIDELGITPAPIAQAISRGASMVWATWLLLSCKAEDLRIHLPPTGLAALSQEDLERDVWQLVMGLTGGFIIG